MKKVITGNKLKEVMQEAVNLLCTTVGATLGPTGNNVLINNSDQEPFITNDGVTIAQNIESDNSEINTVLEIVKEASLKTNELVGDGTTTTLVLLQSIFNEGLKEISMGVNPLKLKKELDKSLERIIQKLEENKVYPTKDNLTSIATISANDQNIGTFLSHMYDKMQSKYSITLKESQSADTYTELKQGYSIETTNISNLYFQNKQSISLDNAYIYILKGYISDLEQISNIVNESFNNKNIIILAEGIDTNIKEEVLVYYLTENKNIFLIELAECASHREKIEEDISILCNCTIKNIDYEEVSFSDGGYIKNITIKKEEVILPASTKNSEKLVNKLKEELNNSFSDYEKEFIRTRLSKLENGLLTIYVGGPTKTEIKEKIMRYEDALSALEISKYGIVPGEGLTLLKVSEELSSKTIGDNILKKALTAPFDKIIENTATSSDIKDLIIKNKFKKIYNFSTNQLESIESTTIIDPLEVVITSIKNSVSISSLLLTTSSLVINENNLLEKDTL